MAESIEKDLRDPLYDQTEEMLRELHVPMTLSTNQEFQDSQATTSEQSLEQPKLECHNDYVLHESVSVKIKMEPIEFGYDEKHNTRDQNIALLPNKSNSEGFNEGLVSSSTCKAEFIDPINEPIEDGLVDYMREDTGLSSKRNMKNEQEDHVLLGDDLKPNKRSNSTIEESKPSIKVENLKHEKWEIDMYVDPTLSKRYNDYCTAIMSGPDYICTSCERLLFNSSVKPAKTISLGAESQSYILNHIKSVDNVEWLCMSCVNYLGRGQIPPQSAYNDLSLQKVPECFKDLTPLERILISKRIGFRKIIECPSGGQKKIKGQIINVPANIEAVCNIFPRIPSTGEIYKVGIKGSRDYTKTYMSDCVNAPKLIECLEYLKSHNEHYENIDIQSEDTFKNLDYCIPSLGDDNYQMWTQAYNMYVAKTMVKFEKKYTGVNTQVLLAFEKLLKEGGKGTYLVPYDNNMLFSSFLSCINEKDAIASVIRTRVLRFLNSGDGCFEGVEFKVYLPNDYKLIDGFTGREINLIPGIDSEILQLSDEKYIKDQAWGNYIKELYRGMSGDNICALALALLYNVGINIFSTEGLVESFSTRNAEKTIDIFMTNIGIYFPILDTKGRWLNEVNQLCTELDSSTVDNQHITDENYEDLIDIGQDSCIQRQNVTINDDSIIFYPTAGSQPKSVFSDTLFEVLSNPDKFPNGKGGYNGWYRSQPITMKQYIKQRLENVDNRFRKDTDYLFSAQFAVEAEQLLDNIKIALRKLPGRKYKGQDVDASFFLNSNNVDDMCNNDLAYKIFSNVRGSQAFWDGIYASSCSCVRQLGCPSWFFTLSAAETRWPELLQILARDMDNYITLEEASKLTWEEKCELINNNPVLVARYFNHRVRKLLNEVILKQDGPIGHITDYIYRIEFQLRGAPHLHAVLYDKNHPPDVERSDADIIKYVEKYQSCELPEESSFRELVKSRMIHVHNKTCTGKQNTCRFDYPRWPLKFGIITRKEGETVSTSLRDYNKMRRLFVKSLKRIKEFKDIEEFVQFLGVNYQEYIQLIKDHYRSGSVLIKRGLQEIWVNSYNPTILKLWRANMDIQYILNPYACLKYITSYMLKSEKGTSTMLRTIQDTYKTISFKKLCQKMATAWFLNRQVGAQECAFRALSLPLKFCSRSTVFVDSRIREHRHAIVVPRDKLRVMDQNDTDYVEENLMDYYPKRSTTLEKQTLADIASEYNLVNINPVFFKKRKESAILRYFIADPIKSPLLYMQSTLLLHLPWRDEKIFDSPLSELKCIYDLNKLQIETNRFKYCKIDEIKMGEIMTNIKIEINRLNEDILEEDTIEEDPETFDDNVEVIDIPKKNPLMFRSNIDKKNTQTYKKKLVLMTKQEYDECYLTLNTEQRQLVDYCRTWCIEHVDYIKRGEEHPPFNICLTGQAGVGKSHCIKMIVHDIYKYLPLIEKYSRDDQLILILAPTGAAAYTVGGITMHSGLSIEIDVTKFKPLNSMKLNDYRKVCKNLLFVILDEISMVPDVNFHKTSMRLQQIKDSPSNIPFGGVNMICCGDFLQLSPVNSGYCYQKYTGKLNFTCDDIWWPYFKKFELTRVQRQKDDTFKNLLSRVRLAKMTSEDVELLESRDTSLHKKSIDLDTLHVFLTRSQVHTHNLACMKHLQDSHVKMYVITACVPGEYGEPSCVVTDIKVCVGIPVILSRNVDVTEGLVNGCRGFIRHIVVDQDRCVSTILLEFSNRNVGIKYKHSSHWKKEFPDCVPLVQLGIAGYDYTRESDFIFTGKFYPFFLGWATTIHKVQGLTIDKLVVSFSRPKPKNNRSSRAKFEPGQAYVALSRVTTLEGLFVTEFNQRDIIANEGPQRTIQMLPDLVSIDNLMSEKIDTAFLNIRCFTTNEYNLFNYLQENLSGQIALCFVLETRCSSKRVFKLKDTWEANIGTIREGLIYNMCIFDKTAISHVEKLEVGLTSLSPIDLWGVTFSNGSRVIFLVIYKFIKQDFDSFKQDFMRSLDTLVQYNDYRSYILGDFNINAKTVKFKEIEEIINNRGFASYMNGSTTIYGTEIDYLFCNRYVNSTDVKKKMLHFTDHHLHLFPSGSR